MTCQNHSRLGGRCLRDALGCEEWNRVLKGEGGKSRKGPAEEGVIKELFRKFSEEF